VPAIALAKAGGDEAIQPGNTVCGLAGLLRSRWSFAVTKEKEGKITKIEERIIINRWKRSLGYGLPASAKEAQEPAPAP